MRIAFHFTTKNYINEYNSGDVSRVKNARQKIAYMYTLYKQPFWTIWKLKKNGVRLQNVISSKHQKNMHFMWLGTTTDWHIVWFMIHLNLIVRFVYTWNSSILLKVNQFISYSVKFQTFPTFVICMKFEELANDTNFSPKNVQIDYFICMSLPWI